MARRDRVAGFALLVLLTGLALLVSAPGASAAQPAGTGNARLAGPGTAHLAGSGTGTARLAGPGTAHLAESGTGNVRLAGPGTGEAHLTASGTGAAYAATGEARPRIVSRGDRGQTPEPHDNSWIPLLALAGLLVVAPVGYLVHMRREPG
ncbi:hypothetical protein GCM10022222_65580 [Amycolatopsis ultiminotia]|uniref:Uncharacterized protein n=1 Tax=Amycolatopsis ultiminotia TaxID=543629 RepID=A0ABP6XTE8_9PSEU